MKISKELEALLGKEINNDLRAETFANLIKKEKINIVELMIYKSEVDWDYAFVKSEKLYNLKPRPIVTFTLNGITFKGLFNTNTRFFNNLTLFGLERLKFDITTNILEDIMETQVNFAGTTAKKLEPYYKKIKTTGSTYGHFLLKEIHNKNITNSSFYRTIIDRLRNILDFDESDNGSFISGIYLRQLLNRISTFNNIIELSQEQSNRIIANLIEDVGYKRFYREFKEDTRVDFNYMVSLFNILKYLPYEFKSSIKTKMTKREFILLKMFQHNKEKWFYITELEDMIKEKMQKTKGYVTLTSNLASLFLRGLIICDCKNHKNREQDKFKLNTIRMEEVCKTTDEWMMR